MYNTQPRAWNEKNNLDKNYNVIRKLMQFLRIRGEKISTWDTIMLVQVIYTNDRYVSACSICFYDLDIHNKLANKYTKT